jgi:hypothetical protein
VFNDIAIKIHNRFEKQDSVHRDVVYSGLSLGTSLIRKTLCLCIARTFPSIFLGGCKSQRFVSLNQRIRYVVTNGDIVYKTDSQFMKSRLELETENGKDQRHHYAPQWQPPPQSCRQLFSTLIELDTVQLLPQDPSMAAAQVLNSYELLSLVFQYFEEEDKDLLSRSWIIQTRNRSTRSSLAKFARVNHLWFESATRVLWSHKEWGPTLQHLGKIEISRRQIYASKMASIRMRDSGRYAPDITALSFPRARMLELLQIGGKDGLPITSIKQYLRPSLNSINFASFHNGINKELLAILDSQCGRLRSLQFRSLSLSSQESDDTDISPKNFNGFLRKNPLERVYLDVESPLINKELLITLGGKEDLRTLAIIPTLRLQQIPECISSEDAGVFKNLYEVNLTVERDAVRSATMAIRHASRVKLAIESPEIRLRTPMFSNLKYMKNLVDLTLIFDGVEVYLDGNDFGCLRTLEKLEALVIKCQQPSLREPPIFENFDISVLEVIFGIPRLHSFNWHLCWLNVSIETLSALSRQSSNLQHISVYGAWDLQALSKVSGCSFPKLQSLILERAVLEGTKGRTPVKGIATQLLRHAPRLRWLSFQKDPQSKVVDAWKQLKESERARPTIKPAKVVRPKKK